MSMLMTPVALRKESVDRNFMLPSISRKAHVALRKESVDRNKRGSSMGKIPCVALRKESVDRNSATRTAPGAARGSLSVRRAWIEIENFRNLVVQASVALRKESVDRNVTLRYVKSGTKSLSVRRAWIEIPRACRSSKTRRSRSPQGERG